MRVIIARAALHEDLYRFWTVGRQTLPYRITEGLRVIRSLASLMRWHVPPESVRNG